MSIPTPSIEELRQHSSTLQFNLNDQELEEYRVLMESNMEVYRALDDIEDEILSPQYSRGDVYQPSLSENPFNAWAAKVDVVGADAGPLKGRSLVLKDNICLAGAPLLNGTRVMEGYVSDSDATVVTRVLDAGARILGKAHCEYLCASGGSHTSSWGHVRNPYNTEHMSGGSSSGCGVLIATGEADLAIGGDQGGSIRIPASFCGIVGMKPTHGLVPYTGISPVEPTMDHAGPMTANVLDNALLLSVLAGEDGLDPRQNAPRVKDYLELIEDGVHGLRIGIIKEGFGTPVSEHDVDACVYVAAKELETLGAVVEEVSIPAHSTSALVWMPITAEGAIRTMFYNHGFPSLPRGFYPLDLLNQTGKWTELAADMPAPAKMVLMLGEHMSKYYGGRYYAKAQNLLRQMTRAYDDALLNYDVLVMPTTPMKAPALPGDDASMEQITALAYDALGNTAIFDGTGHPAMSVPCGMSDGLPVGLMFIGKHYDEPTMYRVARALEKHLALEFKPGVASSNVQTTPQEAPQC